MACSASRPAFALPLFVLAILAGCSGNSEEGDQARQGQPSPAATAPGPDPDPGPAPVASASAQPGRVLRYTSLKDCTLVRSRPEEAGFYEHECRGEGGYRLRRIESDLRQNIVVLAPDGGEHSLSLPSLAAGRFSDVGDTAEWRGTMKDGAFVPDALILRHNVVEVPDPQKETSWLVTVRLAGKSCVTARIAPGPGQNEIARSTADLLGACPPYP